MLTPEAIKLFKQVYGRSKDAALANAFGLTLAEVQELATLLSLGKDKKIFDAKGKMPRWMMTDVAILRERYPTIPNSEIATELGRTIKSVIAKANKLGLKKSVARLHQMGLENIKLRRDRADTEEV